MKFEQFNNPVVQHQATTAGFASVELYIQDLLDRDAEVLAIKEGIAAMEASDVKDFEDFAREFRKTHNVPAEA